MRKAVKNAAAIQQFFVSNIMKSFSDFVAQRDKQGVRQTFCHLAEVRQQLRF